jgi:hypothetical protein
LRARQIDGADIVTQRSVADDAEQTQTKGKPRGQTLRLTPEAWRQLKILAAERALPSHTLLIEALNDLFQKYNKPPIA